MGANVDAPNKLEQWMSDERTMRDRLGPTGVATKEQLRARSGIEFLEAIGRGELPRPPIGELMGFLPIECEPGRVVFQGTPGPQHYNPLGSVHGGYAATLLDSCVGCAVTRCCRPGRATRRWS
jgi:acyl-coenzyme A thioesterase PaaI-like protein